MTRLYEQNSDRKLLVLRQSVIYSIGLANNFLPAHSRIVEQLNNLLTLISDEIRFRQVREPIADGAGGVAHNAA